MGKYALDVRVCIITILLFFNGVHVDNSRIENCLQGYVTGLLVCVS